MSPPVAIGKMFHSIFQHLLHLDNALLAISIFNFFPLHIYESQGRWRMNQRYIYKYSMCALRHSLLFQWTMDMGRQYLKLNETILTLTVCLICFRLSFLSPFLRGWILRWNGNPRFSDLHLLWHLTFVGWLLLSGSSISKCCNNQISKKAQQILQLLNHPKTWEPLRREEPSSNHLATYINVLQ